MQKIIKALQMKGKNIVIPIVSIIFSLIVGAFVINLMGVNFLHAYLVMLDGAFGDIRSIGETLLFTAPLILTALSFSLAIRCGLINIGAEGQLHVGAITATMVGLFLELPLGIHILVALIAGIIGGGIWGLIVGYLKIKFDANEIITTIMLNYVAIYLVGYIVNYPLIEPPGYLPQTAQLSESAILPVILPGSRLHAGFLVGLLALVFYHIFLNKTKKGYEIRVVGRNPQAAEYSGINRLRNIVFVMFISGAFAGLAGAGEIMGVQHRLLEGFSPDLGFDGIAVALIGRNDPVGIFFAAVFFGALRSGGNTMQLITGLPIAIIYIIQGLAIMFVVSGEIFKDKDISIFTKLKNSIFNPILSKGD